MAHKVMAQAVGATNTADERTFSGERPGSSGPRNQACTSTNACAHIKMRTRQDHVLPLRLRTWGRRNNCIASYLRVSGAGANRLQTANPFVHASLLLHQLILAAHPRHALLEDFDLLHLHKAHVHVGRNIPPSASHPLYMLANALKNTTKQLRSVRATKTPHTTDLPLWAAANLAPLLAQNVQRHTTSR